MKDHRGLIWIVASVLLQSAAATFGKQAGLVSADKGLAAIVVNPWYVAVIVSLGLQALCWISALRRLPLSFAYPFMSLVLPLNLVSSYLFFLEAVSIYELLGIAAIFLGIFIIGGESV